MPLTLAAPYPIDEAEEAPDKEYLYTLNFGPQHPATHTTLRLILTLDGETIVKCVPDIGYLHSGFEKLGEDLDYNQYVTVVDRMNYISPIYNEIAWFNAVEKLMGIELTPRCKYIRTIIGELARISDHLLCVGAAALDLGGITAFLYAFNQREKIYNIFETMAGQRFHPSYLRVGGLMIDVNESWIDQIRAFVPEFQKAHADVCRLLNRNRIFLDRTKRHRHPHEGRSDQSQRDRPGCPRLGRRSRRPQGRALSRLQRSRFPGDLRQGGDCLSRYMVRMEEMRESIKIVQQAVENIPAGAVNVDVDDRLTIPDKTATYRSIEGLIQHFELFMWNRRWKPPVEEVYGAVEAPNGELGFYVVSDGEGRPYRVATRPPSFIHFAMFPHLIEGTPSATCRRCWGA